MLTCCACPFINFAFISLRFERSLNYDETGKRVLPLNLETCGCYFFLALCGYLFD